MYSQVAKALMAFAIVSMTGTVSATPVVQPTPERSGGYRGSCSGDVVVSIGKTLFLEANCGNGRGGTNSARIDLNTCFTNTFGTIEYRIGGNFMQTCDIYNFQYSGSTLSDFCDTGSNGKTKYTSFDLNSAIGNSGGNLVC
ncbi:hypothetical protein LTR91_019045 [Friedmanniomyces endolithicus]|uniref:Cyanovirin-N domain-containing protein n=1 Tax=Friedmanniomyces endolithicus TaxID=329885 RepID=A0AAN6K2D2_9PEZI|nr:hypothetical protein LTR94_023540 [Friedmanniomyces endolithicus]KAK0782941.1 hypothetical protein LTR38_013175 [Friedmanniomyces endolithicus]KAK0812557.1 hypothetical protein LTR59_001518 [Friedmanniomyces endolithicus]KAK0815228.1 hypothetical protein LTR75_003897 [Friedmanniomyces endolithicus]KAK0852947.1 hypothetical protein LTR03_003094 [Friedmanniomyces endolithicus]